MKTRIAGTESVKALLSRNFVAVPIILHLAIALPFAYILSIWMDEASTLHTTQNGFFQALNGAISDERQAPLYFLILSLWRVFDDSIFFARILSIISSTAAVFFFHRLAHKLFGKFAANFITVLFAIHPYLIWSSVEIRVYSTTILLSILLLNFFATGFFEEETVSRRGAETQRKARFFYVTIAVVALYTSYYLGFLLVGCFASLIVLQRFRAARDYFLQMLIVGACILPLLWVIHQQFAMNTSGFTAEKSVAEGLKILWNHAFTLTFPIDPAPGTQPSAITVIRICFLCLSFAALIFFLIKDGFRRANEKVLLFGTTTVVVAAFLLVAYSLLGAEYIAVRHVAVLFVPLFLFLCALFTSILPEKSLIFFAVVLTLLFPFTKIYKQYPNFAKRGDWAQVARFIEENEKPNQPIVVFKTYDALTLPYHYKGINRILPDEKFFAWETEGSLSTEDAFRNQIAFTVSKIPPEAQEIWVATEEQCQDKETAVACRPLENFLQTNYTVIETRDFYLERLRLLRKK